MLYYWHCQIAYSTLIIARKSALAITFPQQKCAFKKLMSSSLFQQRYNVHAVFME